MFSDTFSGCKTLTGKIPSSLFAGIYGAPATNMFANTFHRGFGLSGEIPENLFAGITTNHPGATNMFSGTFAYCLNLTGPSAKIPITDKDGNKEYKYLYDIWPTFPTNLKILESGNEVYSTYVGCSGLTDYADMPDFWK